MKILSLIDDDNRFFLKIEYYDKLIIQFIILTITSGDVSSNENIILSIVSGELISKILIILGFTKKVEAIYLYLNINFTLYQKILDDPKYSMKFLGLMIRSLSLI